MACLNFTLLPVQQAGLSVAAIVATLSVRTTAMASLKISATAQASTTMLPVPQAEVSIVPTPQATLAVGEVCSVTPGTIVVLAASDGPLRTRDGGYFLLNPETN